MTEFEITLLLCALLSGGEREEPVFFDNLGEERYVRVDCLTPTHAIEVGLDGKTASRDSVHQAVLAGVLLGRRPLVILIDRDGVEDKMEHEMRLVTNALGVDYAVCSANFIARWRMTQPFRAIEAGLNDLPWAPPVWGRCDIATVYARGVGFEGSLVSEEKRREIIDVESGPRNVSLPGQ